MTSIGIIWNTAQDYSSEIINDIRVDMPILGRIDLDLKDKYEEFVWKLYSTENMEKWKIEKKLLHMNQTENRKITVIFFEFDESNVVYHPFKKKYVYSQLEDGKRKIREKYKDLVNNYVFDIVFHATDNPKELESCYEVLLEYITDYNKDDNNQENLQKVKKLGSIFKEEVHNE